MDLSLVLITIVPIVLYVFVDLKYGMIPGVVTALISTVIVGIFFFYKMGHLDNLILIDGGMLLFLGLLSIKLNNSKLFKLQPTIIGGLLVSYFLYLQIFADPIMVRMLPMIKAAVPEQAMIFESAAGLQMLSDFSIYMTALFGIHAAMVGYAAVKMNNFMWLTARLAIYPMMFALAILIGILYQGDLAAAL